jgi:DNA-binding transcriptional ArsR family regulator
VAKLKRSAHSAKEEQRRRVREARSDLDQLKDFLKDAAAHAASDERLTEEYRQFFRRQRDIFLGSVTVLTKVLEDQQAADVREDRLRTLFEALGSTCVIGSHLVTDQIKNRLKVAAASAAKKATTAEIDEIIFAVAQSKWRKHQNWTPWAIAGEIQQEVNERLKTRGLKPLGQSAVSHHLEKLRTGIFQTSVYLAP